MRESLVITRPTPSPWPSKDHVLDRGSIGILEIQNVLCNWKRGKVTLGGSRTPAPCLEGKDDNRFTTSVLLASCEPFVLSECTRQGRAPQVFPLRTAHNNGFRGFRVGFDLGFVA